MAELNVEILENISESIKSVPTSNSLVDFTNEYQLLETIGEGGFGKVKKAIQKSDNTKVAIKYICQTKITNWFFDKNLNSYIPLEIALMCHTRQIEGVIRIVKYYHLKEQNGWFIVMERFEKFIDLFDYITNMGQITEDQAANFMEQLIEIIMNCHKIGICHRDIKDENIILNLETMKISLIDFGAGGVLHDGYYTEFDGTRVYSPPEWILTKRYYVSALETWSLGILLYDMVCGNVPFENDELIAHSQLTFRRPISRHCQNIIQRCLTKNPTERIQMCDIMKHNWFTYFFSRESYNHNHQSSDNSIITTNSTNNTSNNRHSSTDNSPLITPQSSGLDDSSDSSASHSNLSNSYHNHLQRHPFQHPICLHQPQNYRPNGHIFIPNNSPSFIQPKFLNQNIRSSPTSSSLIKSYIKTASRIDRNNNNNNNNNNNQTSSNDTTNNYNLPQYNNLLITK